MSAYLRETTLVEYIQSWITKILIYLPSKGFKMRQNTLGILPAITNEATFNSIVNVVKFEV